MRGATSRRVFMIAGALAVTSVGHAQQSTSPFVGRWTGPVQGVGEAEIIVSGVRANGQVDGRMVFPEQNKTFTFGDKIDLANGINHGVVQGSSLTIDTAYGGTYRLNMAGSNLSGEYVRGTTYKVPVNFRKAM